MQSLIVCMVAVLSPARAEDTAPPAPAPAPVSAPALQKIVLADGQVLTGICRQTPDGYDVEIQGQIVKIPAALVREVREIQEVSPLPLPGNPDAPDEWPADPNRVGYFYAPSAFTLGAGRGYLSQKELAVTAAAFGVTDFFDIQVGTILPTLFIADSQVAVLGGKLGGKLYGNPVGKCGRRQNMQSQLS